MSPWIAGLLLLLTLLNSIAVIALIRQVGVLHLRIQPLPALMTQEGPQTGTPLMLSDAPWETDRSVSLWIVGFFSPTCGLCGPLMPGFRSLAETLNPGERIFLATDVDRDRGLEYLRGKRVHLTLVSDQSVFSANSIAGAPFCAVVDGSGLVLQAGAVNTLEQVEVLLEEARQTNRRGVLTKSGSDSQAESEERTEVGA